MLLYPYYTVTENQSTVLSVDNTSAEAKAMKVHFLESFNTREVLDFNLLLSPNDVHTAAVFNQGSGREYASQARPDLPEVFTPALVDATAMHERMRFADLSVAVGVLANYATERFALILSFNQTSR